MKTLALYSNKGGVGKTAAAVNLSYLAAQSGYKTLIADLDPQSSTTYYFRVRPRVKSGAKGLAKGGKNVDRSIKGTDYENLDLLPADFSYRNLDITFDRMKRSKFRLAKILKPFRDEYDLIFLDCPPTINILAENIFNATDYVLVPVIPTTLSVRTYVQLRAFFKRRKYNTQNIYTFFSMVNSRSELQRQHASMVWKKFSRVFQSPIPLLPDIEKMGVHREPVPAFAPESLAAKSYQSLWGEIRRHILTNVTI